jgi:hypothetical protein
MFNDVPVAGSLTMTSLVIGKEQPRATRLFLTAQ